MFQVLLLSGIQRPHRRRGARRLFDLCVYRYSITMDNTIVRDVFLAFVRVHVLHHAAQEPIFGLEMMEELGRHGYTMSPGTLYPILQSLEKSGFLRSYEEIASGKLRKYYKATAKGRRVLTEVRGKIRELVGEVLDD